MAYRRRKGTIGDAFSDSASGWYSYEFEFPHYEWKLEQQRGDEFRSWVEDRYNEAMTDLTQEAIAQGVDPSAFVAQMTYELDTLQTDEANDRRQPIWKRAEHVPIFTERGFNAQRIDLVLRELKNKARQIGNNEVAALIAETAFLKKYDFHFVMIEALTLRFHTETFGTMKEMVKPSIDKTNRRGFKEAQAERHEEVLETRRRNRANKARRQRYAEKHGLPWPPKKPTRPKPPEWAKKATVWMVRKNPETGVIEEFEAPNPLLNVPPPPKAKKPKKPKTTSGKQPPQKQTKAKLKKQLDKMRKQLGEEDFLRLLEGIEKATKPKK